MANTSLELAKADEKRLDSLYRRMEDDSKKVSSFPYAMPRLDDPKKAADRVISVTLNHAGTTISDLARLIMDAVMQTVVEGNKLSAKRKSKVEACLDAHYDMIDDLLTVQHLGTHMQWLANHICHRGWIAGRYLAWLDDGEYITDFIPWDMRYTSYATDRKGLLRASNTTWRFASDILSEYPEAVVKDDDQSEIEVVTCLDRKQEEVWIDEKIVKTLKHNKGYVPAVIQPCPEGFMFRDRGYIAGEGESAIFLDRLLFDEWNRIVSLELTSAAETVMPAYTQESESPGQGPPPPYPGKPATNTEVPPNKTPKLVEKRDFNIAAQSGRADLQQALQQGGRNVDVGNMQNSFSAVAIASIESLRKKALIPRFHGIDLFKRRLSWMILDQFKSLYPKFKGEIGTSGKKQLFAVPDLEGDYTIRYRFMSKSKEMEIANIAIASAAKSIGMPDKVVVKDILQAENPEEILAAMESQKAEIADPVIGFLRLAHALVDEADDLEDEEKDAKLIESQRLTKKACAIIRQENAMPQSEPQPTENKGNANALLPLLGAGARGSAPGQPQVVGAR